MPSGYEKAPYLSGGVTGTGAVSPQCGAHVALRRKDGTSPRLRGQRLCAEQGRSIPANAGPNTQYYSRKPRLAANRDFPYRWAVRSAAQAEYLPCHFGVSPPAHLMQRTLPLPLQGSQPGTASPAQSGHHTSANPVQYPQNDAGLGVAALTGRPWP